MKRVHLTFIPIILMACSLVFFQSCRTLSPPRFFTFVNEPMRNSSIHGYLELHEVYDSDGQILLFGWADVEKEGTYVMELKMQNPKGEIVYTYKKDVQTNKNEGQAYVYFGSTIPLDQEMLAKLTPGDLKMDLFCDGKYLLSKQIKYTPGSIVNKNLQEVVILPFFSSGGQTYKPQDKERMLNTMAYAVTSEIKRVAPEVVPHYVAEQKLAGLKETRCLKDPACREKLKDIFGEAVIIEGDSIIPKFEDQQHALTLYVYNGKTNDLKTYRSTAIAAQGGYIQDHMRQLLQDILYTQGLLAYLRGL